MTSSSTTRSARTAFDAAALRPGYATGVALAANALPGTRFAATMTPADRDAAVAAVLANDWFPTLPGDGRRLRALPSEGDDGAIRLPAPGPDADWLTGYSDALAALAAAIPLPKADRDAGAVAVVGLLLDRREPDRAADVTELRRMLEAGLGLTATFLPGTEADADGPADRLARAAVVVSLPYGRAAAAELARRTGATTVQTDLPLGFAGACAWLRAVAAAPNRVAEAEAFLSVELDRLVPRFEWAVPHGLLHKRLALVGDPPFAAALAGFATELGCEFAAFLPTTGGAIAAGLPGPDDLLDGGRFDLCLAPSAGVDAAVASGVRFLEWGFPSIGSHALFPAPTLGLEGVPRFAETLINRMAAWEVVQTFRRDRGERPRRATSPARDR